MYRSIANCAAAVLALSAVPATNAFWRLECSGSVGLARIDPLMDFGGLSGHIHTIKGGSGTCQTVMSALLHLSPPQQYSSVASRSSYEHRSACLA